MFLSLGAQGQGEEEHMVGVCSGGSCSPKDAGCSAAFMGASRPQGCVHAPPTLTKLWGEGGESHEREKYVPLETQPLN